MNKPNRRIGMAVAVLDELSARNREVAKIGINKLFAVERLLSVIRAILFARDC